MNLNINVQTAANMNTAITLLLHLTIIRSVVTTCLISNILHSLISEQLDIYYLITVNKLVKECQDSDICYVYAFKLSEKASG